MMKVKIDSKYSCYVIDEFCTSEWKTHYKVTCKNKVENFLSKIFKNKFFVRKVTDKIYFTYGIQECCDIINNHINNKFSEKHPLRPFHIEEWDRKQS